MRENYESYLSPYDRPLASWDTTPSQGPWGQYPALVYAAHGQANGYPFPGDGPQVSYQMPNIMRPEEAVRARKPKHEMNLVRLLGMLVFVGVMMVTTVVLGYFVLLSYGFYA